MHYDGDPIMGGKDIEVELIPHGLNIIVSDKKKENEPFSLLQQISEIFSGMKPKAETLLSGTAIYLNLTKVYCVVYPKNNKKYLFSEHQ